MQTLCFLFMHSNNTSLVDRYVELVERPICTDRKKASLNNGLPGLPSEEEILDIIRAQREQVLYDGLTRLLRKEHRESRFFQEIKARESLPSTESLVFIRIDLNKFKLINDEMGHDVGDAVLRIFGETIRSELRNGQFAVRDGGDEFIIVLPAVPVRYLEKIICRINDGFITKLNENLTERSFAEISFTSGIVYRKYGQDITDDTFDRINKHADELAIRAKKQGLPFLIEEYKSCPIEF